MLQHVVSSATLTNVEVKVDEKTGDQIMLELLAEEEAQKTADEQKRSKKKRQKDKKKAKKKALEEEKANCPEPEPAAPPEPAQAPKSKKEKKKEQQQKQNNTKTTPQQTSKRSGSESSEGSEGEVLDQFSSTFAGGLTLGGVGLDDDLSNAEGSLFPGEVEEGEEDGGLSEAEILAFKNKYASKLNEEKEKRAEKLRQNWNMRKAQGVATAAATLDGDVSYLK
jgi:DNA mismatch repair ATPase MutL